MGFCSAQSNETSAPISCHRRSSELSNIRTEFCPYEMSWDSRNSLVGTVTRLLAGRPIVRSSIYAKSRRLDVSSKHPDVIRGPSSLNQCVPRALVTTIKWQGRETDHSISFRGHGQVELYFHSPYDSIMCTVAILRYE